MFEHEIIFHCISSSCFYKITIKMKSGLCKCLKSSMQNICLRNSHSNSFAYDVRQC